MIAIEPPGTRRRDPRTEALEQLCKLLVNVPVLHVDIAEAEAAGQRDQAAYGRAIAKWLAEAAHAVAEAKAIDLQAA